jgi:hypothetical protein
VQLPDAGALMPPQLVHQSLFGFGQFGHLGYPVELSQLTKNLVQTNILVEKKMNILSDEREAAAQGFCASSA